MKVFVTGAGGFIGSAIATNLVQHGHQVVGLIRREAQAADLARLGITQLVGSLDDRALLIAQAQQADAVINAADSDHRGAVEALIEGLAGSQKPLLHTSGSSIVGDASGGESSDAVYDEDALPEPTADKAPRVAIDRLVLDASQRGVRSAVLCNTLIYGHGVMPGAKSVQLPRLLSQAQKSGIVRHVGPGRNIWSNTHIDDVAEAYRLALEKAGAGEFAFIESGEASFIDMSTAMAKALKMDPPQDWPLEDAKREWGYEMASYGLGSNSRVRGRRAREQWGWVPKRTSVTDWIRDELV